MDIPKKELDISDILLDLDNIDEDKHCSNQYLIFYREQAKLTLNFFILQSKH